MLDSIAIKYVHIFFTFWFGAAILNLPTEEMTMARKTINWTEWHEWFNSVDLGDLEDVRQFVEAHALDNISDVSQEDLPDGVSVTDIAISTVKLYMDDPDCASVFDYYRS